MDQQDLLKKIEQIEAHTRDALAEYPTLAVERLRMILSVVRHVRSELIRPTKPTTDRDAGAAHQTSSLN